MARGLEAGAGLAWPGPHPGPSADVSPGDQWRQKSKGPGEARAARGRGTGVTAAAAGIFSLNAAVPCRLRSPGALPLLAPGVSPAGGAPLPSVTLPLLGASCHRGLMPPRVPRLGSRRGHRYPLLATPSSLWSARESPEPGCREEKSAGQARFRSDTSWLCSFGQDAQLL